MNRAGRQPARINPMHTRVSNLTSGGLAPEPVPFSPSNVITIPAKGSPQQYPISPEENIMEPGKRKERTSGTESPVRICEDDRFVRIRSHLPGVAEERIRLEIEDTILTISALAEGKSYKKAIRVPAGSRLLRKKFYEGMLEIVFEKTQ